MADLTNAVTEAMTAEIKRRPVAVPSGSIFDGQIGVYGGATMQDLSSVAVAALYAEVAPILAEWRDETAKRRADPSSNPKSKAANLRHARVLAHAATTIEGLFPPSLWGGE